MSYDAFSGGSGQRQIDDNWLLRQNPDYEMRRRRRSGPRSLEGIEIEISRVEENDENDDGPAANVGVVRIHRLLRQTNDMLERLQSDFDVSLRQELNVRRKGFESDDEDEDAEVADVGGNANIIAGDDNVADDQVSVSRVKSAESTELNVFLKNKSF